MKKRKARLTLIFLSVFGVLFLTYYLWLAPSKAVNFILPDINELSYVNAKIDSDTAYIDIIGVLQNKAPYKISIDSLTYNIELAGVTLIAEHKKLNIKQESGQKDTVMLTFRLPISKTHSLIKKLQGKDSTDIMLNLDITYNTLFGKATIPFSKVFDINVPTPPEIKITKIKAGDLDLKHKNIDIDLVVSIKNKSENLDLHLKDLVYDTKIGNHIKGNGKYVKPVKIKPLSTILVVVPINVKVDKPFEVIWKVITNKDLMNYEINLQGTMVNHSKKDLPIYITATGETELLK